MKRRLFISLLWLTALCSKVDANAFFKERDESVPELEVAFDKTLHLIFCERIVYVDLGSQEIIAGKAPGVENILRVKSQRENPSLDTTLSVVTQSGTFYCFRCIYNANPKSLSIHLNSMEKVAEVTDDFSWEELLLIKKRIKEYEQEQRATIGKIFKSKKIEVAFLIRSKQRLIVALKMDEKQETKVAIRDLSRSKSKIQMSEYSYKQILSRKDIGDLTVVLLRDQGPKRSASLEISIKQNEQTFLLELSPRERKMLGEWE
ncbi:MAG: DUF4138 domain-containing protein [Alistipes sp.]|nr:DUF4138 domain-containing protein [Candidatus Alistipes equi]